MRPLALCARSLALIAATLLSGTASAGLVTRGDVEHLALVAMDRTGNDGTSALASELCGVTVDGFGGGGHDGWPEAKLQSWLPLLSSEGTATVHLVGVGYSGVTKRPITGPCEGTLTFKYQFHWVERGDNIVGFHEERDEDFTEAKVARDGAHGAATPLSPRSYLEVSSDAYCTLRIDGALAGMAGLGYAKSVPVTPGEHLITCSSHQVIGLTASARTAVAAEGDASVTLTLEALEKATDGGAAAPPAADAGIGASMIDLGSGVIEQVSSGLRWAQHDNGADVTWEGARQYCGALSLSGGGWRLPTAEEADELSAQLHNSEGVPCGDAYCSKSRLGLSNWWFWLSERKDATSAWIYDFRQGYAATIAYLVGASSGSRALCVRSPRAEEVDTLQARIRAAAEAVRRAPAVEVKEIDRGGGVLEQVNTGLQWTQSDNGRDITRADAQTYCAHLATAGGRWRIPNMDELGNLFNDAVGTKTLPCGEYYCGVPPGFTITSHLLWSAQIDESGKSKGLYFDNGYPAVAPADYKYHSRVLCVRHP